MAKSVSLLLLESVEGLGIVGDVVSVRTGYARNYLLPREIATEPSDELIAQLAEKRAEAQRQLEALREARKDAIEKLEGFELTLERACNDQGLLYGSVTQQDIVAGLLEHGFDIRSRAVRIPHTIKRIDSYDVLIKLDQDLETSIKLWVVADRELQLDEREEMEFDEEGNLIEKSGDAPAEAEATEKPAEEAAAEA